MRSSMRQNLLRAWRSRHSAARSIFRLLGWPSNSPQDRSKTKFSAWRTPMRTLHVPGFTADRSLPRSGNGYVAKASFGRRSQTLTVTPATMKNGTLEWIDCNGFPEGSYCRECGATGPGSVVCCPDDYCVVIDKTPSKGGIGSPGRVPLYGRAFNLGRASF